MNLYRQVVFFLLATLVAGPVWAQTIVKGMVRDAASRQPLQNVSVYFVGGNGSVTNAFGEFSIQSRRNFGEIALSALGYVSQKVRITPGTTQQLEILLVAAPNALNDVVVSTQKRAKYTNKDNPAVELIRKVVEHRDSNRVSAYRSVQYQQYEKMQFALSSTNKEIPGGKVLKKLKFDFLLENVDTSSLANKILLPFFIEENITDKYLQRDPDKQKVITRAKKKVNFGEFIDNAGISQYLNYLYQDVDIYQDNIVLLTTQILSPIANAAPSFYMFYIRDTTEDEHGTKLVRMSFYPRNTNDHLFRGTLFVTLDGRYAVQKINMSVNQNININWVKELVVNQTFQRNDEGRYFLEATNIKADFGLTQGGKRGIYGERTVAITDLVTNQPIPDSVFRYDEEKVDESDYVRNDTFWQRKRLVPLTPVEQKVYLNIDSLQHNKRYRRLMDWATLLLAGYKKFGWYEVGPVSTFYSFNPIEGFRLRAGGRTTLDFSKRIFIENYLAYGFKDKKVKGFSSVAYSINNKSIYHFPYNYVKLSYQHDTKIPGQDLQFVAEDNFLLSFKRGRNDKLIYNDIVRLEYIREYKNHFSYNLGFTYTQQVPAGTIDYKRMSGGFTYQVPNLKTSELSLQLRWAPNELYYQGKQFRRPIPNKYPIVTLTGTTGIKGLFRGQYDYQKLNLNIFKRCFLSFLGYSDVVIDGGYVFGKVPFPITFIHRANQSFAYQLYSYNLMNFLEFTSDHYAALTVDHHFNGFFFNRVPFLHKLKWREIVSAKFIWGGIRDQNNPGKSDGLYKFPTDEFGNPITFVLNNGPYVEGSVGVGNILKIFRVDYVKRFSYLNNPNVAGHGIRIRTKFEF
jgi:hypothetical protein